MTEGASRARTAWLNGLWAEFTMEELWRLGVQDICIAPGSRSTPLTLAAARHPRLRCTVHFDERGCGFHAIGLARARGAPAAIICTSGTAAANLYPAVVEATMDNVPLILLTADRPPELRDTAANQTIPQTGLFGAYPRWQADLPTPTTAVPVAALLTTLDQAVHRSRAAPAGPVHLNMPFREPLNDPEAETDCGSWCAPVETWRRGGAPFTRYHRPDGPVPLPANHGVAEALGAAHRGLLVVGRLAGPAEAAAVRTLATRLGWPTLADIGSGLRLGHATTPFVPHYDLLLKVAPPPPPDTVLHLGGEVVSKVLMQYLEAARPPRYIRVYADPRRHDPSHQVNHRVDGGVAAFADAAATLDLEPPPAPWLAAFREPEARIHQTLDRLMDDTPGLDEPAVCRLVSRLTPRDGALFLASSMPVRDMDSFADPCGPAVPVACNRGASGIDGTVATACGYAAGLGRRLTLVCGDLALLHDLNALALVARSPVPITLVVINNDGGGIFSFLPVTAEEDHFETFFATPHGLGFASFARGFGLHYQRPGSIAEFAAVYGDAARSPGPTLIEVRTERTANRERHRHIITLLSQALEPHEPS
ncbi:MAG: 2-succinyl-5-enolpyruvyl-6-hydroxy-3-cyclohexene-1-carboxylic-acid synthase [Gammaproteobacteria bacterium]|nr:2-succinyl-5-enolpyruvyl-6-hydroxy-3-cyclohexene-1-carboxylic-acid synthase [Gammaproteobacteria bacterium]